MNCEIIKMNENTWRLEDGHVRFFLLAGTEKALLVDSGMNVHNAKDIAAGLTELPIFLLNTHADRDHIGSNEQFEAFYMHPAEEALYRRSGKTGTVLPVEEGDVLDLGERRLQIIHLPGHTPGSIAVLDIKNRVLISGDPIQTNGRIFLFGSHRNMKDYIRSLEHLEAFKDQFDELWPSHGDIPISPEIIGRLRDGARDILERKIPGKPEEVFGHAITAYDLGFTTLLCDSPVFKTGSAWRCCYDPVTGLYTAEIGGGPNHDLYEITKEIFDRVDDPDVEWPTSLIHEGRHLYMAVDDRCGPPYTVILDTDYQKLCPWAKTRISGQLWDEDMTDAAVEVFASEAKNRPQRRAKKAAREKKKAEEAAAQKEQESAEP